MDDRHRKLARQNFWEEHDREHYECPDCGRRESAVVDSFEVHHINGEPRDNRSENHVALCRLCHHLREGRKPPMRCINQLRDSKRDSEDKAESASPDPMPDRTRTDIPFEVWMFVRDYVHEAPHEPYANPFAVWWHQYEQRFGTRDITAVDLMNGLMEYSDAEVVYDYDEQRFDVYGVSV